MNINSVSTFVPANVSVELDNGSQEDIFVLIGFVPSFTVSVPDTNQYELVRDRFDEFVDLLEDYYNRPVDIPIPEVPEEVLREVQMVREQADEHRQRMQEAQQRVELQSQELSKEETEQKEDTNAL